MCTGSCLDFVAASLTPEDVKGLDVLEVGALDVNGSARALVTRHGPAAYLGVDMQEGPGVDDVCAAEELVERYGRDRFDVVLTTEMLEHVFDWRAALHNLKDAVKPRGLLVVTTRSFGFGYHAYPYDFWRYELDDMRALFADFELLDLAADPLSPGVFLKARKPEAFVEADMSGHALYSMITRRRSVNVTDRDVARFHKRRQILMPLRNAERAVRRLRDRILG
ncbi:MAG TPA: methyltransferase domain-containing protein [Chthonomonadaceae bacterium]|nr:methyltransferase domain-containing protein [Chthonomonadaceae bacterium]